MRYQCGIWIAVAAAVSGLLITGCLSSRFISRGIEPEVYPHKSSRYIVLGPSEGQSSSFNLIWLIPVTPRVNYKQAADEAIGKLGGDNLIDVKIWMQKTHWIIGTVDTLHVKGTVIQYKKD